MRCFARACGARPRQWPTAAYDRQRQGWRDYRWREIGQAVQQWQQALRREPLQAGDRVAIALPNSPQWVIFDQAALGLGLVVVPLYVDDRPNNTAYILEDCGARLLLLVDETHWLTLAGALAGIPTLERILLLEDDAACRFDDPRLRSVAGWLPTPGAEQPPLPPVEPRQLATLIYTSGTTGRPKGVMLSHANILANVHGILSRIEVYRQDLLLSFLPLAHALERTAGYYVPMAAGATVSPWPWHSASGARSVTAAADGADLRAPRLRNPPWPTQPATDAARSAARVTVPLGGRGGLAPLSVPAAAGRLASPIAALAAAAAAGRPAAATAPGWTAAAGGQWRRRAATRGGAALHRPGHSDRAGLWPDRGQPGGQLQHPARQRSRQRRTAAARRGAAHRRAG